MNALRNKVSLIGRLGRDPEMVTFESGKSVTRFSLATHQKYKLKNGEWSEDIQWHNVSAWGPVGKRMSELLAKGKKIIVEGRLTHQTYENKDGERKNRTVVEANEFMLLTPKFENNESEQVEA